MCHDVANPYMRDTAHVASTGITSAIVQLVDQAHPADSIMPQEVCQRPLLQPVHGFFEGSAAHPCLFSRVHENHSPIGTNLRTELPGGGASLKQLGRVRMFAALVHPRS
jgi:hypothetical protein